MTGEKWIVNKPDKDQRIKLVSKTSERDYAGALPKGSYLTIIDKVGKPQYILAVEDSFEEYPYAPSPFITDLNIDGIDADLKGQNIILAKVVKNLTESENGIIKRPQPRAMARRSNQDEIDLAMAIKENETGPEIFLATIFDNENQVLCDDDGKPITTRIKDDFIFYQTMVVGKTGSGKTVATKYLAQYFVEKENPGCVLAINVKDIDFLKMYEASNDINDEICEEWKAIGNEAHRIANFQIFYPSNVPMDISKGINPEYCTGITLNVEDIEPESMTGLLQTITDNAAQNLPDIFRYWRDHQIERRNNGKVSDVLFADFLSWFGDIHKTEEKGAKDLYDVKSIRGLVDTVKLASGTAENILRNLRAVSDYFDNENGRRITIEEIMRPDMMSVIDIQDERSKTFGAILLRHLLSLIVKHNSGSSDIVPTMIIIDEVHQFYNTKAAEAALGDLDTICRQGRSQKIGVVFSSQNPNDLPSGLTSVINTKLFFKSDITTLKAHGISVTDSEMQNMSAGYAVVNIHGMSQLKMVKFPLSYSGVVKKEKR